MDLEDLLSIFNASNKTNSNMCTILYNKQNIIAIGYNKFITHVHVFKKKFLVIYTKVSPTKKRKKLSLIVLRKNNRGEFMNSKPCMHCIMFMKSKLVNNFINIRDITFFEDNKFKRCTLNELHNNHVSRGWRGVHGKSIHCNYQK